MAAARNSWHRLVCADQIMTRLPVNILLLVAAESVQCTLYTLYIPWNIKTNRVCWKFIERYFLCWILAMKTCSPVNFYSVQISPNTSPAHRFHWLARPNFAKQGSARNLQEFANWAEREWAAAASHDNRPNRVPAAGLDHHVCLLSLIDPQPEL